MSPTTRSTPDSHANSDAVPTAGVLSIAQCYGPPGAYTYHVDVKGGGDFTLPGNGDRSFNFATGAQCSNGGVTDGFIPTNAASWPAGTKARVTITPTTLPPNTQTDSIQYMINGVRQPTIRLPRNFSVRVGFSDVVFVVFFSGHTPQGCGESYWKASKHAAEWVPSGLTTTQLVGSLLSDANLYSLNGKPLSDFTLAEALNFKGGSGLAGSAQLLVRAAIAAELNSRRPQFGYPLTQAQVGTSVDRSLTSQKRGNMLVTTAILNILNNHRCPLR